MPPYSEELVARLFANIDADDVETPGAQLPAEVSFACTEAERRDSYMLSLQMLEDYVDRGEFCRLISVLIRRRSASAEEIAAFRKMRSCFKHMRYSCANFDARHRYPRPLHKLTALMGDFQDAVINDQKGQILKLGLKLRLKLNAFSYRKLLRSLTAWQADNEAAYQKRLRQENATLAEFLRREPLRGTGNELHNLRKIISRRVALNDTLRALRPSPQADAVSLWLATLNGRLGDIHDQLVAESLAGKRDYKRDIFTPPAYIAEDCKLFLARQRIKTGGGD